MSLIATHSLSTWIYTMARGFVASFTGVSDGSRKDYICPSCGFTLTVRTQVDSTLSLEFSNRSHLPKLSPFKHFAVLTPNGKLSIYCAPLLSGDTESDQNSGSHARTFYLRGNSGRPCGCDPKVEHRCDEFPFCEFGAEVLNKAQSAVFPRDIPRLMYRE